ncbi:MAG: penicillin-binding protein 2 [Chloroflexota bacterium]|nr:penicillin-binding protein 2 [Chloroflexota bacterium]
MSARTQPNPQLETLKFRLQFVIAGLVLVSGVLLVRLASFQFQLPLETVRYLETLRDSGYRRTLSLAAARGNIYDRHGEALAVNTLEYQIGISPILISDGQRAATQLAAALELNELDVYEAITSDRSWLPLASQVSAEMAGRVVDLELGSAVTMQPIPRRSYPQGTLGSQILGFVSGDLIGYYGVEGYYQGQLAGSQRSREISNIPFELLLQDWETETGRDLVLTIDRDVQYIAEDELARAIESTGSTTGTILIINPRNGEILAVANYPTFNPNNYFEIADARLLSNPSISEQYEPGSVMKVITVAAALETGAITSDFTYNDQGALEVGGITVRNWDRNAYGVVDVTRMLVDSLNVGAATVGLRMGPTDFYTMIDRFGFGRLTGVDLQGEQSGTVHVPGDEDWSEAMYATSSFGQGIAVTPMQMLAAVSAIANDGLIMQPHIVRRVIDGDNVIESVPTALRRPISAETAAAVTEMMVAVVRDGYEGAAALSGYSIAGKSGTAQIPTPTGYDPQGSIASFVGFLPADDPQIAILIKLDRPRDYWGGVVATPIFRRLIERLVVTLEIPPDAVRIQLAAQGGSVADIQR